MSKPSVSFRQKRLYARNTLHRKSILTPIPHSMDPSGLLINFRRPSVSSRQESEAVFASICEARHPLLIWLATNSVFFSVESVPNKQLFVRTCECACYLRQRRMQMRYKSMLPAPESLGLVIVPHCLLSIRSGATCTPPRATTTS